VDEQHRDAVHNLDSDVAGVDFHVKVVEEIQFWRSGLNGPFNGCAFPIEFRSVIVVPPAKISLSFDGGRHDLIVSGFHTVELEFAHEVEELSSFHQMVLRRLS
jgi:hypothetical protein